MLRYEVEQHTDLKRHKMEWVVVEYDDIYYRKVTSFNGTATGKQLADERVIELTEKLEKVVDTNVK